MKSLWNAKDARACGDDPLALRVYTSRLLGASPELVLHGGGNTSVKTTEKDFFGDPVEVCHVKGSGWDLGTIAKAGFAPVRLEALLKMAQLKTLTDTDMVLQQRAAMLNPNAPNPSVEAILHAIIPFKFVDHTHSNAIVALTNNAKGKARVQELFGKRVIIVPYVMPGFILSQTVAKLIKGRDLREEGIEGMILLNHGIFTFSDDARESYELMIEMVSMAEKFLAMTRPTYLAKGKPEEDLLGLAELRKHVSEARGTAVLAKTDARTKAVGYSNLKDIGKIATRGPLTPDHSIRTKRVPVVLGKDIGKSVAKYVTDYTAYFEKHKTKGLSILPADPRYAIWPGKGVVSFGTSEKETGIIYDIAEHTYETIQAAESVGGWKALSAQDVFDVEYWELEQAKLAKGGSGPIHQGKVALISGSAAGIGFACAQSLAEQGAKVIGFDLSPEIVEGMASIGGIGVVVNLTDEARVKKAVDDIVREFGGLDIVVSNAGIFTAGAYLQDMEQSNWDKSMAVNLTSHQMLLKHTVPYLKLGIDPAVVLVGSRNVNAPGAGAASYSCAKAGLTQLCRVAALELAPEGVRCNIIHPDAVFDTKLWTAENLKRSAERYNMTVEEYKTRNLLKTEIKSKNVGDMVAAVASPLFSKTTGAQIPVDGGNDRVI